MFIGICILLVLGALGSWVAKAGGIVPFLISVVLLGLFLWGSSVAFG